MSAIDLRLPSARSLASPLNLICSSGGRDRAANLSLNGHMKEHHHHSSLHLHHHQMINRHLAHTNNHTFTSITQHHHQNHISINHEAEPRNLKKSFMKRYRKFALHKASILLETESFFQTHSFSRSPFFPDHDDDNFQRQDSNNTPFCYCSSPMSLRITLMLENLSSLSTANLL